MMKKQTVGQEYDQRVYRPYKTIFVETGEIAYFFNGNGEGDDC